MTLWRLEFARLRRTYAGPLLIGVFLFFAIVGPFTARYLDQILELVGEGMIVIDRPPTRPVDGIAQFVSNTVQLGALVLVIVAAGGLSVHARPEVTAFLRTRVARPGRLLVRPVVVTTAAAAAALTIGTAIAAGLTAAILGPLPVGPLVTGTLLGILFQAFVVALVAGIAAFVRSQLITVFAALAILLVQPLLTFIDALRPWVPTELGIAVVPLLDGAPIGDYAQGAALTALATIGLVALAVRRSATREL